MPSPFDRHPGKKDRGRDRGGTTRLRHRPPPRPPASSGRNTTQHKGSRCWHAGYVGTAAEPQPGLHVHSYKTFVRGRLYECGGGGDRRGRETVSCQTHQRSSHRPTLHPLSKFGGGDRPLEPRGAVVPCWCYRYTALVASCVSRGHVLGLSGGHCCQLLNLRKYLWTGLPFDVEKVGKRYLCSTSQAPCTRGKFNTAPI